MNIYIYCADVYCEACGKDIRKRLGAEGRAPACPRDEYTYDSDDYPKGPYDAHTQETDTVYHCGSGEGCLDPTIIDGTAYGRFIEKSLTADGQAYVLDMHRHHRSQVTEFWVDFYGLGGDDEEEEAAGGEEEET